MPEAGPLRDGSHRYRLSDERAARLLARLDATAELVDAVGQTEHVFELENERTGRTRVTLRFTLGQEFGELAIEGDGALLSGAPVYAAGPIERILAGIGFHEVGRRVVVARRYRQHAALIRVAHFDPIGWFCEITPADVMEPTALLNVVQSVRDDITAAETTATHATAERRVSERRGTERRAAATPRYDERRTSVDRRIGDRRLSALS